jgi:branched-chain amino acid transport system ATP-binding protein
MIYNQSIEILDLVGLKDKEDLRASSLPYGEQKLLEIARAMATKPELLLLDEPASGLNLSEIEKLVSLVRKIRDRGITIILIDHQMGLILDISDEVLVLNYGKKIAEGTPSQISSNQDVVSAYLGMGELVA